MWNQVPKQDKPPRPMRAAVPTARVPCFPDCPPDFAGLLSSP